jgi:small subunit ribosomal protein S7
MPRRKNIEKRVVLPDPKFKSKLVTKFINCLMKKGKKSLAESILYKSLDIIQAKTGEDPIEVFKQAVENAKPVVEVKSRRVGGSTYQVPVDVRPRRRESLSIRWLTTYARQRKEHTMQDRLAIELLDAYNKRGTTIKKKEDTHRMAEANKAFAHYRW